METGDSDGNARKQAMRARILETADRLFYGQGIRAVGVDTIAAEAGISKRTLYNHFASKDALIAAYLEQRLRPFGPSGRPPREQILRYFDRIAQAISGDGFRGCPFVNAVAELGLPAHPAGDIALRAKENTRTWFRDRLAEIGTSDPDALALQLTILVDGAIAAGLVRHDPDVALSAKAAAAALIDAAEETAAT